jgi:hypothetical protein
MTFFLLLIIIGGSLIFTQRRYGLGIGLVILMMMLIREKLSLKKIAVPIIIATLITLTLIPVYRNIGFSFKTYSFWDRVSSVSYMTEIDYNTGLDIILKDLAYRMDGNTYLLNINTYGPSQGKYLAVPMLNLLTLSLIPSAFWPDKIEALSGVTTFGELIVWELPIPPVEMLGYIQSIPTDLFASGGWLALCFGGIGIGWLLSRIETWAIKEENLVIDMLLITILYGFFVGEGGVYKVFLAFRTLAVVLLLRSIFYMISPTIKLNQYKINGKGTVNLIV